MNFLDIQLKHKTFGIYFLVVSLIASLLSVVFLIPLYALLFSSSLALQDTVLTALTFVPLSLLTVTLYVAGVYTGIRYVKENSLKRNKNLGTILVALGLLYLGYSLFGYIFSNLTDNPGGGLKIIMAFIWTLLIIPFGLVLRNPKKI